MGARLLTQPPHGYCPASVSPFVEVIDICILLYDWLWSFVMLSRDTRNGWGRVLTPLQRALGRTELNIYLPDELVLIACRHRTDSMQPVKNSVLGRTCVWDPYFFLRRTERPDRMGTNEVLFNGDFDITVSGGGHILRTTHCCCAVACAKRYLSYWFWLARPKILDGPRTRFFIQGRNERPWKASFRSFRFHKVE